MTLVVDNSFAVLFAPDCSLETPLSPVIALLLLLLLLLLLFVSYRSDLPVVVAFKNVSLKGAL